MTKSRLANTFRVLTLGLVLGLPVTVAAQQSGAAASNPYVMTGQERWKLYLKQNYANPGAFFRSAWPATIAHLGDEPPEWEQGISGYGKRLGDQFASRSIAGSVNHGLAAAMKTDPRYERCACEGFFPRFGHAVLQNFVTRRTDGRRTFNAPNIAGRYAGEFAALSWQPDRFGWKDGFREGSQRVMIGGSFNLLREFWPEMRRVVTFGRK